MCIRDRLVHLQKKALPEGAAGVIEGEFFFIELPAVQQGDRCLLYTSDAAAERSSVDFGGRRILKKKKKITNDITDCE